MSVVAVYVYGICKTPYSCTVNTANEVVIQQSNCFRNTIEY